MKVSHNVDHATSAVIGGMEASSMRIAATAEFMQILSESLYNYPVLAYLRETLSNGEDAHKEAGVTKPIEITVDDTYVTFRDYGNGIPHRDDIFNTVYGTYGKGTKEKVSNAIGGFGLGCKSPHAVCDVFEVTSCSEGIKTVYNIVKASRQKDGNNAIIPIMQVPTEESGVTVKIPYSTSVKYSTKKEIINILQQLILLGDFDATINGNVQSKLGMSMEAGTVYLSEKFLAPEIDNLHHRDILFIRYANILYPVPNNPRLKGLDWVKNLSASSMIILQAEPDSLSIQPSREAISATDYSITNLEILINNTSKKLKEDLCNALPEVKESLKTLLVEEFDNLYFDKTTNKQALYALGYSLQNKLERLIKAPSHSIKLHPMFREVLAYYSKEIKKFLTVEYLALLKDKYSYTQSDVEFMLECAIVTNTPTTPLVIGKVYKKALKVLIALNNKQVQHYLYTGDSRHPWDSEKVSSRSLPYLFKRTVVVTRTLTSLKQRVDMYGNKGDKSLLHGTFMVVRCGTDKNVKDVVKAMKDAGINPITLSGDELDTSSKPVTKKTQSTSNITSNGELPLWNKGVVSSDYDTVVYILKSRTGVFDVTGREISYSILCQWGDTLNIGIESGKRAAIKALGNKPRFYECAKNKFLEKVKEASKNPDLLAYLQDVKFHRSLFKKVNKELSPISPDYANYTLLDALMSPLYKGFKPSKPSEDSIDSGEVMMDELQKLKDGLHHSDKAEAETELKKITSMDVKIPESVKYKFYAITKLEYNPILKCENLCPVKHKNLLDFLNRELKRIENEYKNKDCSHSRNYGYYHPVQRKR